MEIWLALLGMGLVTLFVRALPLVTMRGELPAWLNNWLRYVPVAVFTALVLPPLIIASEPAPHLVAGPQLVAGLAGAAVAWWSKNVLATIVVGFAVFWLLRMLGW